MYATFSNARYTLRQLRKTPAVTLTVMLTLGLAIGINTAMFSVIDRVLPGAPFKPDFGLSGGVHNKELSSLLLLR